MSLPMRLSALSLPVVLAGGLIGTLGGCVPLVAAGAGAGAGTVAASDRGIGGTLADEELKGKVVKAWRDADLDRGLDVTVNNGRALLTGVTTAERRVEAVRLAWQVTELTEVINEIQVEGEQRASGFGTDGWITTQLRGKLIGDGEIRSLNYSIDTVNQVVYLMGRARSQAELDRVLSHARDIPRVLRVVSYVRL